jgi:hypothetical protein
MNFEKTNQCPIPFILINVKNHFNVFFSVEFKYEICFTLFSIVQAVDHEANVFTDL